MGISLDSKSPTLDVKWCLSLNAGRRRRRQRQVSVVAIVLLLLYVITYLRPFGAILLPGKGTSPYRNAPGTPISQLRLPKHDYAFAAFLAAPEDETIDDADDKYFVATRMLAYQLLHDPLTRTNTSIPFLVLVTDEVTVRKRARLEADGATIVPVERITSFKWIKPSRARWEDVLSKLYLFDMTQYQRILFLDSDMLIAKRLDGIFDDPATRVRGNKKMPDKVMPDEGIQPESYVFAGVSGQGGYNHPYPGRTGNAANAGFIVLRPSRDLFEHYMAVLACEGRFDSKYPEQNLWIYIHRRDGNMPWQQLDPTWNVNWATMNDYEKGAASLHTKWWSPGPESELRDVMLQSRWKMEGNAEARDAMRAGHG